MKANFINPYDGVPEKVVTYNYRTDTLSNGQKKVKQYIQTLFKREYIMHTVFIVSINTLLPIWLLQTFSCVDADPHIHDCSDIAKQHITKKPAYIIVLIV